MAAELTKRSDLGQFLNALGLTGRGAEIGVYRGDFSREVLAQWHGSEWCLIDPWVASDDYLRLHAAVSWDMEAAYSEVQRLAAAMRGRDRSVLLRGLRRFQQPGCLYQGRYLARLRHPLQRFAATMRSLPWDLLRDL